MGRVVDRQTEKYEQGIVEFEFIVPSQEKTVQFSLAMSLADSRNPLNSGKVNIYFQKGREFVHCTGFGWQGDPKNTDMPSMNVPIGDRLPPGATARARIEMDRRVEAKLLVEFV